MLRAILFRILFLTVVFSTILAYMARASDFMALQEASLTYKNFRMINPGNRNPLTYPESAKEGIDFNISTNLFWGWAFVQARVESLTAPSQFREVGLERRIGLHLGRYVDLSLYHLSEHYLDGNFSLPGGFPEGDAVELKVWFFRR